MLEFNIDNFILEKIINHPNNYFHEDILENASYIKSKIYNKKILIIGGAGTIGSNYTKQVLKFEPSKIVIVDINENALTELTRELRSSNLLNYKPEFITYPINLLSNTFDKVFYSDFFDVVANFSAHKHVRSEKDVISIEALIKNNIYGAIKLLRLCEKRPPHYFFSVSTDKATNPINVMGASKALMEKLIFTNKNKFRVTTARFANVAFSNGSLFQGYLYRIVKKQPLSCPENIKRFFVTPKQSGEICLLATFLGENGNIFFPKLNFKTDLISLSDITIDFIKYLGYEPITMNSESEARNFNFQKKPNYYPVYFFKTTTTGEKIFEEFYSEFDKIETTQHKSIGIIKSSNYQINFDEVIKKFNMLFEKQASKKEIIELIKIYVPDFLHKEQNINLDQKM